MVAPSRWHASNPMHRNSLSSKVSNAPPCRLPDTDCKDVIVGYIASYSIQDKQSSTPSACRGEICTLSLYIRDSKLDWDIQKQISGTGKAIFVKTFGEPDPETK